MMGGRNESESPADFRRNWWPTSIGIGGRNHPEYALALQVRLLGSVFSKDVVSLGCRDESVRGTCFDFVSSDNRTYGVDPSEPFLREVYVCQFLEFSTAHFEEGLLDLINLRHTERYLFGLL